MKTDDSFTQTELDLLNLLTGPVIDLSMLTEEEADMLLTSDPHLHLVVPFSAWGSSNPKKFSSAFEERFEKQFSTLSEKREKKARKDPALTRIQKSVAPKKGDK
jgi:hypothetical protein